MVTVKRVDGYAPIADYAAVGDGRTAALIARDGSIDWLCLPDLDSPSTFGALLDARAGGRFELRPEQPFEATRRYLPGTNVLETTFSTADGRVRVTDAMTLPTGGLPPYREVVRRVESLSGEVPMRWRAEPRPEYGAVVDIERRAGVYMVSCGTHAVAVLSWDAGEPEADDGAVGSSFVVQQGSRAQLVLAAAHQEPVVFPARDDAEARLQATERFWHHWTGGREYDGPWRDAVLRSALALKLLVYAPSGAIAASVTSSLPETIGGERNWDYRFSWPRDSSFALRALLGLGCSREAQAFFSWLMHASQLTHPEVRVLYRLNGRPEADEQSLPLAGYRGSRPVRVGNAAVGQTQLDVYGELLDAATQVARSTGGLDRDQGGRLAEIADHVCRIWRKPDAGIWEVRRDAAHFTQSKMMCAVALDRACSLADQNLLRGDVVRWRREADKIREFVETRCYSERKQSYTRSADEELLDAALLMGVIARYDEPTAPRLVATVDAVRRELADGPLVHRYVSEDGLPGEEGAFLACSFWLVEAYACQGRLDEATELMDELVGLANDVGLYSEEIDPATGEFLGNFPQGLSHLALISAAVAIDEAAR
ncbi:MAG TPA: glycoside hydrolase family 15 protein [Gaiellaceae bacterium]|nr:glycoside hydrolase family 15 protein [Gaiellaceae bacterium]